MTLDRINQLFRDTAYVRPSGTDRELACAEYLKQCCAELGHTAHIEPFPVDMAAIHTATLELDGVSIPCKGYLCAGSHEVEADFYYMRGTDRLSLSQIRGKIVLVDSLGCWSYRDLLKYGAVGFITYGGSANYPDEEFATRELRAAHSEGNKIPGVTIHVKQAMELISRGGAKRARIVLKQDEYVGESRNVVLELPGESDEIVVFSAHYDSTPLSIGAFDNMTGCAGLLGLIEYFTAHPHRRTLRFVFCGSEERGLLGAKAYVAAHADELEKIVLNINIDMMGCIMGRMSVYCSAEEASVGYVRYFGAERGMALTARQNLHSSDSTVFADKGIPAISFARSAPNGTGTIHNRFDTAEVLSAAQIVEDTEFIAAFADRMVNAAICPVSREIPDSLRDKIDQYLLRKRPKDV